MKNILNDKCGMGAYVLNRSLKHNIAELGGLNYIHLIRNFSIFILGYSALIILIQSSKFNKSKNNILNKFSPIGRTFPGMVGISLLVEKKRYGLFPIFLKNILLLN